MPAPPWQRIFRSNSCQTPQPTHAFPHRASRPASVGGNLPLVTLLLLYYILACSICDRCGPDTRATSRTDLQGLAHLLSLPPERPIQLRLQDLDFVREPNLIRDQGTGRSERGRSPSGRNYVTCGR